MRQRQRTLNATLVVIAVLCALGLGRLSAQQAPTQSPVVNAPGTVPDATPSVPTVPAVTVTEVKSPAAPAHFQEQAIWALLASFLIQYLKKSRWFGFINEQSPQRLKATFGLIVALLTAAGVHLAVSGSLWSDGGATVTVTGLSFNVFKDAAWQWGAQQGWYNAVVKEPREIAVVNNQLGGGQ